MENRYRLPLSKPEPEDTSNAHFTLWSDGGAERLLTFLPDREPMQEMKAEEEQHASDATMQEASAFVFGHEHECKEDAPDHAAAEDAKARELLRSSLAELLFPINREDTASEPRVALQESVRSEAHPSPSVEAAKLPSLVSMAADRTAISLPVGENDGHRRRVLHSSTSHSSNNGSVETKIAQLPPWVGDGHGSKEPPAMTPARHKPMASLSPWSGDGHGSRPVHTTEAKTEILMRVNAPAYVRPAPVRTAAAPTSLKRAPVETGKLLFLVMFFFLWISVASTLLFLYMDRYLF